jgi:hypothetical protein
MSDQPQRPAEQALRDYADQRRAQAPPADLHPATRRLLQGEVARTYGAKNTPAASPAAVPWLATWWGRLALGAPALAAIVVVIVVLNREREMHLAMSTDAPVEGLAELAAAKPDAALAPAVTPSAPLVPDPAGVSFVGAERSEMPGTSIDELKRKQAEEAPIPDRTLRGASLESVGGPAPTAAPAAPSAPMLLGGNVTLANSRTAAAAPADETRARAVESERAMQLSVAAPADAFKVATTSTVRDVTDQEAARRPAAPAEPITAASGGGMALAKFATVSGVSESQALNRQQFVQAEDRAALRRNFNSPAPSPVLNSFQFENAGYAVRIIDADGSVYSGQIVGLADAAAAAKNELANSHPEEPPKRGDPAARQSNLTVSRELQQTLAAQTVFFRVQGTNHTLQQAVEFEGNLLLPALSNQAIQRVGQLQQVQQQAPTPALLQQGQIQGRAIIGGRTQLDVRAGAAP